MKHGQTLVIFLVFMVMAITIITAAVAIVVTNSVGASNTEVSQIAYNIAESGMENALISLLRNPSYTGETLTVGDGQATITVTGTNPQTVVSLGRQGDFIRSVQTTVSYNFGVMNITSWREVY